MVQGSRLGGRNGRADGHEGVIGGHGEALVKDTNPDLDNRRTSQNPMRRPSLVRQVKLRKGIPVRRQRESLAFEAVEVMREEDSCRIRGRETRDVRGGSKRRHTSLKGCCSAVAAKRFSASVHKKTDRLTSSLSFLLISFAPLLTFSISPFILSSLLLALINSSIALACSAFDTPNSVRKDSTKASLAVNAGWAISASEELEL